MSISFILQSRCTFWAGDAPPRVISEVCECPHLLLCLYLAFLNHYYQYYQHHPVFSWLVTVYIQWNSIRSIILTTVYNQKTLCLMAIFSLYINSLQHNLYSSINGRFYWLVDVFEKLLQFFGVLIYITLFSNPSKSKLNQKNVISYENRPHAQSDFSNSLEQIRQKKVLFWKLQCAFWPNILELICPVGLSATNLSTRYPSSRCALPNCWEDILNRRLSPVESTHCMWKFCAHSLRFISWPSQEKARHIASIWCGLHRGRNVLSQTSFH